MNTACWIIGWELEVAYCNTWKIIESFEADDFAKNNIVEDSSERCQTKLGRRDGPVESRVMKQEGRKRCEPVKV